MVATDFTRKHYTGLERLVRDERSSLFGLYVSNEEKSYITLAPGVIASFFFVTD
jgi:hypothetical protein